MDRYLVLPFWLSGQHLAVALDQVVRVLPALQSTPLPGAPETICGLANVRGKLLPVVDLARRFGWKTPELTLWQPFIWLTSSTRELLLPVDQVEAVLACSAEDFTATPDPRVPSSLLRGVVRSSDGLLLIQDVELLLSDADEQRLDALLATQEGRLDAAR
ncbi:purine-binding chemotaxis protein CheW [Pseudomonas sp. LPB0260]|uniref:chemotaxis protein CheW n=1 Tax=Pseudomonas sp. LPB0260 TaxID=2614442 RepID=UPI0015C1DD42|nr:chemotaxis protein CheW [Pseudomonas sp. LPB0260]QLC72326.1 purine-binding chemotaxis protein CheW [Pseudomonas sp. LPB0260]QLC75103.1 purine-binding chemotaxis protein CheW [Pseudomonas sp. LPB0260]